MKPGYKQTEIGVIPDDWVMRELADFALIIDGDRGSNYPSSDDFSTDGYCLFLSAQNVTKEGFRFSDCSFISKERDQLLNKGRLARNDIVLTTRGTVGNIAFFDGKITYEVIRINSGMVIIRNIHKSVQVEYLYWLLRSKVIKDQVEKVAFGSAQPQLTVKVINTFQVPFPPTIEEQNAIVEALGDVDDLLAGMDRLIVKKRVVKTAVMQQLLTGEVRVGGGNGRWETRTLGVCCQPRSERVTPEKLSDSVQCIELEHIEQGTGRVFRFIQANNQASIKTVFHAGDVLFGKLRPYLRKFWLADQRGVCSTEIWALVTNGSLLLPSYLHAIVQTDRFIDTASEAYGTHMPRADWNVVKAFELELPPLDEQRAIATILTDIDAEITALQARRDKTAQIKQAMMQELLTGRTRLPLHHTDTEP